MYLQPNGLLSVALWKWKPHRKSSQWKMLYTTPLFHLSIIEITCLILTKIDGHCHINPNTALISTQWDKNTIEMWPLNQVNINFIKPGANCRSWTTEILKWTHRFRGYDVDRWGRLRPETWDLRFFFFFVKWDFMIKHVIRL